ncbi:MAG: hypothetical protein KCHDKBKB_00985 [Elusimicrobia bacterium]|nr:hypothetical protein [Elusimicrobiota bacterium]
MEISVRIGTTAEERAFPQILGVTLHIMLTLKPAGNSDSLEDTLDYAALIKQIRHIGTEKEFTLIESLAERIASVTLQHPKTEAVTVTITKKVFTGISGVGAYIYREKTSCK